MIQLLAFIERCFTRRTATVFAALLFPLSLCVVILKTAQSAAGFSSPLWGNDFVPFWVGVKLYRFGGAEALFDPSLMERFQAEVLEGGSLLLWHYPPTYLFALWPLGNMTIWTSFAVFSILSISAWYLIARLKIPTLGLLGFFFVFGAPAVTVCILQGQNGLLTAALFAGALIARDKGLNWLAGALIAGLLIKPHLGLLIPVALIAARDFRIFSRAAILSILFVISTLLAFGPDIWIRFFNNAAVLDVAIKSGDLWSQQPGLFAFASLLGASYPVAMLLHGLGAACAVLLIWMIWQDKDAPRSLQNAALLTGALMITPFAFRYDMTLTLMGLAFVVAYQERFGWRPGEKALIGCFWIVPAVMPALAEATSFQIGTPALLGQFLYINLLYRRHMALPDAQS